MRCGPRGASPRRGCASLILCSCGLWLIALSLAGCASGGRRSVEPLPATALTVVGESRITDDRPQFRAQFCRMLRQSHAASPDDCDVLLWRLPDEKAATDDVARSVANAGAGNAENTGRARVLIFAGAFGDCFPPWSTPFAGATALSESAGFDIEIVSLSGRSSSERNASAVRDSILGVPASDAEPLILIGYSKGAADILAALVRYPRAAARVAAVISIAGAINGSPLASHYRRLYNLLLRWRTIGSCAPGDGRVLDSLERTARLSWLSRNPLPRNVRYYSVVTFTFPPRIARILAHTQRILSRVSPRNDGQLLAEDQLIPGSALLGFVNADHWGVALRMEDRFPFLVHRPVGKHAFPRSVLLEAALRFVREDLHNLHSRGPTGFEAAGEVR